MRIVLQVGIVLFACLFVPAVIWAQSDSLRLPEVVVTATAAPAAKQDLPVAVEVLDRAQIEASQCKDLDGLLRQEIAGDFQVQPGGYSSIGIRGFESYESAGVNFNSGVLVLVDGLRLATGNLSLIPLDLIQRVEVVHGPGSALYGGSAMGGVINVLTRSGGRQTSGKVGLSYGSWGEKQGRAVVSGRSPQGDFGLVLAGSKRTRGDYAIGGGKEYPNTQINQSSWGGKLTVAPDRPQNLNLLYLEGQNNDQGSPGVLDEDIATDHIDDQLRQLALSYRGRSQSGEHSWRLSAYCSQTRYENQTPSYNNVYDTEMLGLRGQADIQTGCLGTLSLGSEYVHVEDDRGGSSVWEPNSEYDLGALFFEQRLSNGPWGLWAGARYDYYRSKVKATAGLSEVKADSETFAHPTWRLGARYWLTSNLGLHAAVGTGFRPPLAKELAGRFTTSGYWGTTYIGNPDLKPEHSLTCEAGIEYVLAGLDLDLSLFSTRYTDKIVAKAQDSGDYKYENSQGWRLQGLELMGRGRYEPLKGLVLRPHCSARYYTKREDQDSGHETIQCLPEYEGLVGIKVGPKQGLNLDAWLEFRGPWEDVDGSSYEDISKDPFSVLSARLNYAQHSRLTAYFQAKNILDRRYDYKDGYYMPGRSLVLGLEYQL